MTIPNLTDEFRSDTKSMKVAAIITAVGTVLNSFLLGFILTSIPHL